MARRLTKADRAALARERAERRQAILDQADALRAEAALLARDCAAAAFGPVDDPRQDRLDALLARLDLARAALALARSAINHDDPDDLGEHPAALQSALGRWKRASAGWWEARFVRRPKLLITQDPYTGELRLDLVSWSYGPYFYRLWRQDGQQHSEYFGRTVPDGFPLDQYLAPPDPEPVAVRSSLAQEALALAERLAALTASAGDAERKRRLHRLVKRAGRRVERRVRAENAASD